MPQKTFGPFSGAQLTAMFIVTVLALLVPGTLWAVDAYQNVAIQDPITGKKAAVDAGRRVLVYDPISGAAETPASFVSFQVFTGTNCDNGYTVPAGKALVIQSMSAYLFQGGSSSSPVQALLYGAAGCGGGSIAAAVTNQTSDTKLVTFGSGIVIPTGRTVSGIGFNNTGSAHVYGYLVPAGWAPASAAAVASSAMPEGATPTMTLAR